MRVPFHLVFAAALTVAALLPSPAATAAEIKLMCPAPMRTTITDLVAQFERATPHKVTIVHTPSRMIIERVQGGEAFDVSILTAEATDGLIKQGKIAMRVDVARSSIGLAVRSGAPAPDVSSAEGVKRTLLAAKTFARNEGAESGRHMLSVFARLGITEQMAGQDQGHAGRHRLCRRARRARRGRACRATDAGVEGGGRRRPVPAAARASAHHRVLGGRFVRRRRSRRRPPRWWPSCRRRMRPRPSGPKGSIRRSGDAVGKAQAARASVAPGGTSSCAVASDVGTPLTRLCPPYDCCRANRGQSRRNTTDANQPVNIAIIAVAMP